MGFFQDLKQDLSQTVNEMVPEEVALEIEQDDVFLAGEKMETLSEDLFGQPADLSAMNVTPVVQPVMETKVVDAMPSVQEIKMVEEAHDEVEELLNEVEKNMVEPTYVEKKTAPTQQVVKREMTPEVSSDTAVITEGMTIVGDVKSSGNMDVIGTINGNIEIMGKLNITGNVHGNSSAAEIYADSAQVCGEVRSKGSVKIGQSSVIIGNIFANSAVIAGAVKGDIDIHGPVILDTSAIVMGNIKSKSVQINNGAVIEGMCSQCYADISPSTFFNDVKKKK